MKWILSIWTMYMMTLAAMPCSDAVNRCEDNPPVEQAVSTHNHNSDSNDYCTPFCYCSCCSVSMTAFDFKPFEVSDRSEEFLPEKIIFKKYAFVSSFYENIWHPPKSIS